MLAGGLLLVSSGSGVAAGDCHVSTQPDVGGLTAPGNLTGTWDREGGKVLVRLYWEDLSGDETCFVVERLSDLDPETWVVIGTAPANIEYCIDWDAAGAAAAVLYYRVYSATSGERSEYSPELYIALPPDPTFPGIEPTPSQMGLECGAEPTPVPQIKRADLNCDGQVNEADLIILLMFLGTLPFDQPAGCPPVEAPLGGSDGGVSGAAALGLSGAGVAVLLLGLRMASRETSRSDGQGS